MKNDKLEITTEKVREAASRCSTAAATLKVLFPEAFKFDNVFNFGKDEVIISTAVTDENPLFIGHGLAPSGLEGKCLMFDHNVWKMKTQTIDRFTVLTFQRK